ncbi:putative nucleotide binding protein [Encephalitozoon cuniculi EcunIII-L]|uniref:Nbp35-like nucleotide binding protein n=1 Tax=Encephalitozoon cuniculi TaxID=6035 RepID=M1KI81_ENCCN|nr:nbp35-like nucleotide binding protein [Encephalitozoon cuniculi]KMV65077.1 putative nucleotide binding protein [Encephalitozoon cuniculi EcunIII-L]
MGESCPGVSSKDAGKAEECKGCPNVGYCSQPVQQDPDIKAIQENLSGVKAVIAVMSGKGGVGKSTITRNIAELMSSRGIATCILDLDLSGPSIPRLTGTDGQLMCETNGRLQPVEVHGLLKAVSAGYLQDPCEEGVVFSSTLKTSAMRKLLKWCSYEGTDVLLLDTPPNVTDEHLGMVNFIRPRFGIVVTTPQKFSLQDVARQVDFCRKARIEVLGIIENMKRFTCQKCGHSKSIFRSVGVESYCMSNGIAYLGSIDLKQDIAKRSDSGDTIEEEVLGKIVDAIMVVCSSKA